MTAEQRERVRAWVDALRSGAYPQAMGALRRGDAYCCLGVACDLYRRATGHGDWVGRWTVDGRFVYVSPDARESAVEVLSPVVKEWFGLPNLNPFVTIGSLVALGWANDAGASFAQIADAIEAEFLREAG